jgi:hypothetical protein
MKMRNISHLLKTATIHQVTLGMRQVAQYQILFKEWINMKISMYLKFQLFSKENGNLIQLTKEQTNSLSIGGYCFVIGGKAIPFDWDAFSGGEEGGVYEFDTGYGWFNDFELSDCYDRGFERLGISRDDITAEFLASAEQINEIHMNFVDENDDECDFGCNDSDEDFKIKLLEIILTDIDNDKEYKVSQEVLDKFNEGGI